MLKQIKYPFLKKSPIWFKTLFLKIFQSTINGVHHPSIFRIEMQIPRYIFFMRKHHTIAVLFPWLEAILFWCGLDICRTSMAAHAQQPAPSLPLWVSMARSGHTADPSGPTHQYMLGSLCDMPAIKAWGSWSPKAGRSSVVTTAWGMGQDMDAQSCLTRNFFHSCGEKHNIRKTFSLGSFLAIPVSWFMSVAPPSLM